MRIDNLYLVGKMFKNISPDSVRSGRTCPANLGVRFGQETHAQSGRALLVNHISILDSNHRISTM